MRLGEDDKKMFEFARLVEGVSPRSGWEVMRVYLSERLKYVRMLFHEAALGDASLGDLAHIAGCENVCERIFSDLENFLCKPYCFELEDEWPHISADADVKVLIDTLIGCLKEFQNVRGRRRQGTHRHSHRVSERVPKRALRGGLGGDARQTHGDQEQTA